MNSLLYFKTTLMVFAKMLTVWFVIHDFRVRLEVFSTYPIDADGKFLFCVAPSVSIMNRNIFRVFRACGIY